MEGPSNNFGTLFIKFDGTENFGIGESLDAQDAEKVVESLQADRTECEETDEECAGLIENIMASIEGANDAENSEMEFLEVKMEVLKDIESMVDDNEEENWMVEGIGEENEDENHFNIDETVDIDADSEENQTDKSDGDVEKEDVFDEDGMYTCVLCEHTFSGYSVSQNHLLEHISKGSYECLECDVIYTASCWKENHTLIDLQMIGQTLQGRMYKYYSKAKLLVREDNGDDENEQVKSAIQTELLRRLREPPESHSRLQETDITEPLKSGTELETGFTEPPKSGTKLLETHFTEPQKSLNKLQETCITVPPKSLTKLQETGMTVPRKSLTKIQETNFPSYSQPGRNVQQSKPITFESVCVEVTTNIPNASKCPFVCLECQKEFSTGVDFKVHNVLIHKKERQCVCQHCNMLYTTERQLKSHLKQNEKNGCEVHVCTFCNKVLRKRETLRTHLYKHTGRGSFQCPQCKKSWKNRSVLKRHLESHKTEKSYQCAVCDKYFSTSNSLKIHMYIHTGERAFSCNLCSKVYSERRFLRVHMYTHTGEGKFGCKICSQPFYSSSQLKLHMCKHTGERPHVCKICNERFLVRNSLLRHMYRHNGQKPYSCITCGKRFVLKQDLNEHTKTHAIRTFMCQLCDRGFTTGAYLNRHMKQHERQSNGSYQCVLCSLTFMSQQSLKRHQAVHRDIIEIRGGVSELVDVIVKRETGNNTFTAV